MADDDANDTGPWFELSRRKAFQLPFASFLSYNALMEFIDRGSAEPRSLDFSTEAISTRTIEAVPLPTQAESISMTGTVEAWVSASSSDPALALYAGDELLFELSCTPDQAGSGCYTETEEPVEVSADLSAHAGEEIEIEYATTHNGGVTFVGGPVEFTVDGESVDIGNFPLPEITAPPVTAVGKGTEFSINDDQLGVAGAEWTVTSPDTDDVPTSSAFPDVFMSFEEAGVYTVTADPLGQSTSEVAQTDIVVIGEPRRESIPTAIENDEELELEYTFEVPTNSIDPSGFEISAECGFYYQQEYEDREFVTNEANQRKSIDDYEEGGFVAETTITAPPSTKISVSDYSGAVPGLGYRTINIELSYEGVELYATATASQQPSGSQPVGSDEPGIWTYAFETVDEVGLVAAYPAGENPNKENNALFEDIRTKSEFLNEYYASGQGAMGAKGFNIHVLNRRYQMLTDEGWLELDDGPSEFGGARAYGFVEAALRKAEEKFPYSVSIASDYDTAFVISPELQGEHPFYGGNPAPVDSPTLELLLGPRKIEIASYLTENVSPVHTTTIDSGTIDTVHTGIDLSAWRHEFGHGAGPGNLIGLPDMYYNARPYTLGTVQNWGLMGEGDTMTAFSRLLGGDVFHSGNRWLEPDISIHFLDISTSLSPLTAKKIGDSMQLVLSSWVEFVVGIDRDPLPHVNIIPYHPKVAPYILEARRSGNSQIKDPFSGGSLILSGESGSDSGIAVYRFTTLTFDSQDIMLSFLDGASSHLLSGDDEDVIGLDYLSRDGIVDNDDTPEQPTLSTESNTRDTKEDPETFTKFSVSGSVESPEVDIDRDELDLVDSPVSDIPYANTVIAKIGDFFSNLADELGGQLSSTDELPTLDLLVETDDGRRAGVDPGTGSLVNEIDGARVFQTGASRGVTIPGDETYDVDVSAERLKAALREREISPPEQVEYERVTIVDNETTIEERDGVPYLSGRMKQRATAETGDETSALTTVGATFQPEQLNARSQGNFVTARIEIPEGFEASDLVLKSVVADTVQAVTDDQYGFVRNVPQETHRGTDHAVVKFPRGELITQQGVGEHRVSIVGAFDRASFTATGELTIFEPGANSDGGNGTAGDGPGNGPPGDLPGRESPANGPGN